MAAFEAEAIVAVAIVGRPIARSQADGVTAEVSRLCTHNAPANTATALLKRVVTACQAIGYHRVITYVDGARDGIVFKAANFVVTAERSRHGWHGRSICVAGNTAPTAKLFEWRAASYAKAVTAAHARKASIEIIRRSAKPLIESIELPLWSIDAKG